MQVFRPLNRPYQSKIRNSSAPSQNFPNDSCKYDLCLSSVMLASDENKAFHMYKFESFTHGRMWTEVTRNCHSEVRLGRKRSPK